MVGCFNSAIFKSVLFLFQVRRAIIINMKPAATAQVVGRKTAVAAMGAARPASSTPPPCTPSWSITTTKQTVAATATSLTWPSATATWSTIFMDVGNCTFQWTEKSAKNSYTVQKCCTGIFVNCVLHSVVLFFTSFDACDYNMPFSFFSAVCYSAQNSDADHYSPTQKESSYSSRPEWSSASSVNSNNVYHSATRKWIDCLNSRWVVDWLIDWFFLLPIHLLI